MERAIAKAKSPIRGTIFLSRKDIATVAMGVLGFFLGRVVFFQFLNPIVFGYLSTFLGRGPVFYAASLFAAVGLATKLQGLYLVKYGTCLLSMLGLHIYISKKKIKPRLILKSALGGISVLISAMLFAALNNMSLYFFTMAFLEGFLTFGLTYVLKKSSDVMLGTRHRKILSTEEIISLAILFGGVLAGAADIYVGIVSLRIFLATTIILLVGYKGGSALGATTGVLLGLMLYFVGYSDMTMATIFSVCGLTSGISKYKGKIGSVLGFAIGGAFIIFYADPALFNKEILFSAFCGATAFALIPDNFYFNVSSAINPVLDNADEYIERVKEITTYKLNAFSEAFYKLSKTFTGLSEKKTTLNQKDVSKLIDDIAAKACNSCGMKSFCWQNNFYDTYQTIFSILGACEKKGRIDLSDIPIHFRENCIDLGRFTDTANRLFELNKVNLAWNNRIVESRELVSQQLFGVSSIIKNLADELDLHINFKEDMEENIIAELNKNKIEVDSVIVLENKTGKFEVTINHKPCFGRKNCSKDIAPLVGRILGRKMRPSENDCTIRKNGCQLRLVEEQKFRIISGVSKLAKSGSKESGDSYSFMEMKNGQCLLALSDGMGSGARAKSESAAAIELLEDFIESGFEKEIAVKMINSALVLKSSEDSFSTLDICSVDLYTAQAEFIKIGAATTFLLRNGAVQVIKSGSLPIGILNTVDLEISTKKLKNDDIIVMVTDGLTEITDTYIDKGAWLIESLSNFKGTNPQDIADFILTEAENKSEGTIKDDMTVLAARIWER